MHSVRKPWWQQATALVTVTTGGLITGFNFVPGAAATMTSPTSVPLHLLALEQAAQPGAALNARAVGGDSADSGTGDTLLRSAIVNVAKYYLQIAATRSPAQMEALIWDNTSLNGADHGPSCAAFASLTLELAAQAVGQQSWVSGGSSYPFPLPAWADVRVDTNPASPGVTSVMADAAKHDRWHRVDDGYRPQPGDWVLFDHHVEVVTRYSGGVLETIGADSDPGLTVNAHSYGGTPAADGVVGFVDNGHLEAASFNSATAAPKAAAPEAAAPKTTGPGTASPQASATASSGVSGKASGTAAPSAAASAKSSATPSPAGGGVRSTAGSSGGQAVVPGITGQASTSGTATSGAGSAASPTEPLSSSTSSHGIAATASAESGAAAIPGALAPVTASAPASASHSGTAGHNAPATHSAAGHSATATSASSGAAAVPGIVQPAGATMIAGSGTGSGTQTVEGAGQAAAIPGAHMDGKAPAATASSGIAVVPGASPAAVDPASRPSDPASRPSTTPTADPTAVVPGSNVAQPASTASAAASATPSASAEPSASASPTPSGTPSATAAPTTGASSSAAKSEQYKQYAAPAQATPGTRVQQAFISLIAPGAVAAQQRWGVPAAVTIAQAIEESSWGKSGLSADYYNLFGIKGSGPAGSVALPTSEFYNGHWVTIDAQFRVYHNVAESIADHAELLATSGYYQRAMADRAIPDAFANDLTGVYATDPDYGANLIAIMKLYNLYRFDGQAHSAQSVQPQAAPTSASATPSPSASVAPTASPATTAAQPTTAPSSAAHEVTQPAATPAGGTHSTVGQAGAGGGTAGEQPTNEQATSGQATGGQATIPGLGAPALAPTAAHARAGTDAGTGTSAAVHQQAAQIPGMVAPPVTGADSGAATTASVGSGAAAGASAGSGAATTGNGGSGPATTGSAGSAAASAGGGGSSATGTPTAVNPVHGGAEIPGLAAQTSANYQRQPAAATTAAPRYQPQFTTAVTTAYFATAKGPLGHGEHLYRDVASQTGIRWELLAACDWMQCKAHPRYSPVRGEKIGALNSDGTSYATKSAALGQCARDLIELSAAVYGIDLTARRLLSVRALADAFAAFRWGALLVRHGVSAMEFPYSVAGLTAQHQKMHWPVIDDPAAPDRPGARFREPFGAVPVVLSLDYPATVLTDRKRRQPRVPVPYLAPTPVQPWRPAHLPDQQVTVQLADGQLARGRVVERRSDGEDVGPYHPTIVMVGPPAGPGPQYPRRRWHRFIPRWAKVAIVVVVVGVIFRRVVAWAVLAALSAALHLFGASAHLPHVSFGWPWSSTTTNTLVGPIVLQKIEGIDKPALGTAKFDFTFTRKVTKNIGFLPCWYSATFAAVGRASATVDLNPGTAWWKSSTGHYQLRVLSQPTGSIPGKLAITMALPLPQLPQSVHDVSIDNTLSSPISTNHSWTYPGLACGALIRPQFAQSALYSQAQTEAFNQATTLPSVTKPLIAAAEKEATTIIRDNFISPTVGALNYTVTTFSIRWVPPTR